MGAFRATGTKRQEGYLRRHSSWLTLAVILLAGTVGPSNIYKVPPLMPILMSVMDLSKGGAGLPCFRLVSR
jgi:hypothetical protein